MIRISFYQRQMWQNLRTTKTLLWIVLVTCAVFLAFSFTLGNIFADSNNAVQEETSNPAIQASQPVEIEIEQMNGRLRATVRNASVTDWQYVGPNPISACNSILFNSFDQSIKYGNEIVLEPLDYGRYYCLRALRTGAEYVYQNHLVIHDGQLINISQDINNQSQIILQADYQGGVSAWQHIGPLTENVCGAENFTETDSFQTGNTVVTEQATLLNLSLTYSSLYYCFRAQNEPQSWIYRNHKLELVNLQFFWERKPDQLQIRAEDLSPSITGEYVIKETTDQSCALEDFVDKENVTKGNAIPINPDTGDSFYCFRLKYNKVYYYTDYLLNVSS